MKIQVTNNCHGCKKGSGLMLGLSFHYPYTAWVNKVKHKLINIKFHLLITTITIVIYFKWSAR